MIRKLLASASLVVALHGYATAEPIRPANDDLVLATVAPASDPAAVRLSVARDALAKDPKNEELAIDFARLAIEQGRANADPRSYGQAQAALQPWWTDANAPENIRVLRAVIFQALHNFKGAEAEFDAILAVSPRNAQARLSRAFVRMVMGNPMGAAADCTALPRGAGGLVLHICEARVEALAGRNARGYERMKQVLARNPGSDLAMARFALSVKAEIAASLGNTSDAEAAFILAAQSGAREVALLTAHADLLLDMGKPTEALQLLETAGESELVLLRRAIAAKRLGDARLEGWSAILNERFAASAAGGVRVHLREEARFRLEVEGDAARALALALEDWQVQKEPADVRLVLECALAAKDKSAAKDVLAFVKSTGLTDQRIAPLIARVEGLDS